jgi:hypothetical protein
MGVVRTEKKWPEKESLRLGIGGVSPLFTELPRRVILGNLIAPVL